MNATVVEERGTHLLVARGDRFAIVERRNGRLYNCHGGKRDGIAADDPAAIAEIVDAADWVEEAVARRAFSEVGTRGADLAERMW